MTSTVPVVGQASRRRRRPTLLFRPTFTLSPSGCGLDSETLASELLAPYILESSPALVVDHSLGHQKIVRKRTK